MLARLQREDNTGQSVRLGCLCSRKQELRNIGCGSRKHESGEIVGVARENAASGPVCGVAREKSAPSSSHLRWLEKKRVLLARLGIARENSTPKCSYLVCSRKIDSLEKIWWLENRSNTVAYASIPRRFALVRPERVFSQWSKDHPEKNRDGATIRLAGLADDMMSVTNHVVHASPDDGLLQAPTQKKKPRGLNATVPRARESWEAAEASRNVAERRPWASETSRSRR